LSIGLDDVNDIFIVFFVQSKVIFHNIFGLFRKRQIKIDQIKGNPEGKGRSDVPIDCVEKQNSNDGILEALLSELVHQPVQFDQLYV
jgi:hypothetical protein